MARHLSFLFPSMESAAVTFNLSLFLFSPPSVPQVRLSLWQRITAVMSLFKLARRADIGNLSPALNNRVFHLSSPARSNHEENQCSRLVFFFFLLLLSWNEPQIYHGKVYSGEKDRSFFFLLEKANNNNKNRKQFKKSFLIGAANQNFFICRFGSVIVLGMLLCAKSPH